MTRFQTIFLGILILFGVAGTILFAVARNENAQSAPALVMWGTIDSGLMEKFVAEGANLYRDSVNVTYVEKSPESFEGDLVAALARGQGPDMVLLPQDLILKQLDKFYQIPFENYSVRTFRDSFIAGSELYLDPTGVVGFPFAVDPLVMYWNRTLLSNAGSALPPALWTELFALAPKIVKKDSNGNILQSLVAFGEVRNVTHAKDILALLAMQAGSPIVARDSQGVLMSALRSQAAGLVPAEEAVSFFTEFSNPVKPSYSWNRAIGNDRSSFIGGKLALYFGYASELSAIRAANPNLDFDVAEVPQAESGNRMTFGQMQAVSILRASPNVGAAYVAAATLTNADMQALWSNLSGYPPVRRSQLTTLPGDAYKAIFYKGALVSRAWLDPYREASDGVFMRMVENVTSGKLRVSEAVGQASTEIDNLLRSNI